jgi:hypothetical protein
VRPPLRDDGPRQSGSRGLPRRKHGMGDRYFRTVWVRHDVDTSVELLRQGCDDARAQPGICLVQAPLRRADPIVGHRESPVWLGQIIGYDDTALARIAGKRVLDRVDDELGDDQTDARGLGGRSRPAFDLYLQGDRAVPPIIEAASVSHNRDK